MRRISIHSNSFAVSFLFLHTGKRLWGQVAVPIPQQPDQLLPPFTLHSGLLLAEIMASSKPSGRLVKFLLNSMEIATGRLSASAGDDGIDPDLEGRSSTTSCYSRHPEFAHK
jgi:hypothetical protein